MTIEETVQFCQDLIENPYHKAEVKLGRSFLKVMGNLQNRVIREPQLGIIEQKLRQLDFAGNREKGRKDLCKKVNEFLCFLRAENNWVEEGYYASRWMIFGMMYGSGLGVAIGTAIGGGNGTAMGISMGTGIGMVLGMALGGSKDAAAKKAGRVLG